METVGEAYGFVGAVQFNRVGGGVVLAVGVYGGWGVVDCDSSDSHGYGGA